MTSTDVATEKTKAKVATHALLNSAGEVVDDEESASGIRYTLMANGQTFEYKVGASPDADRMLAIFGAKTLATNETSQVRNNPKGDAGPDAQIASVRERFALLGSGQWVDRTREPGVAAINKEALVRAIATYATENGKTLSDDQLVALRQKVEEDKQYVKGVRSHTRIAALYALETGKPQATDADIFAGL